MKRSLHAINRLQGRSVFGPHFAPETDAVAGVHGQAACVFPASRRRPNTAAAAAPNRISIGGAGTWCPPLVLVVPPLVDDDELVEDEDDVEVDDDVEELPLVLVDPPEVAPLEVAPPELEVDDEPLDDDELDDDEDDELDPELPLEPELPLDPELPLEPELLLPW
jgi:hypothetical protein